MSESLEERIRSLPCWRSEISLAPLKGGLTNLSFVATDGDSKFVVRGGEAMKAASLLREALWALVSEVHLKTPGVDYPAHAREYFDRLSRLSL